MGAKHTQIMTKHVNNPFKLMNRQVILSGLLHTVAYKVTRHVRAPNRSFQERPRIVCVISHSPAREKNTVGSRTSEEAEESTQGIADP